MSVNTSVSVSKRVHYLWDRGRGGLRGLSYYFLVFIKYQNHIWSNIVKTQYYLQKVFKTSEIVGSGFFVKSCSSTLIF